MYVCICVYVCMYVYIYMIHCLKIGNPCPDFKTTCFICVQDVSTVDFPLHQFIEFQMNTHGLDKSATGTIRYNQLWIEKTIAQRDTLRILLTLWCLANCEAPEVKI